MSEIFRLPIHSRDYPELLRTIHQPPSVLYCRGNSGLLRSTQLCAIVGSRTPTPYGLACADAVVDACVERELATVSGLAFGIDIRVHERTVARNGQTIAVLGSSVDDETIYPKTHTRIAHEILSHGGLLISENAPGTRAHKGSFPQRNRIISGISQATCVIEAKEKSGSLITAYSALEQDREVFAIPGSIFSPQSQGTLGLIVKGATPWISAESFQDIFPLKMQSCTDAVKLDEFTRKILTLCSSEQNFETLQRYTSLPAATLQEHLASLMLSDYIHITPYGNYIATRSI